MNFITRTFIAGVAMFAAGCAHQRATTAKPSRPNIIVIVADDLGYADLGCQGSQEVRTPHIDSIAAAGVRFTSGYVALPVCSPSRAGLLTGRYPQRFGHEFNPGRLGLPLDELTLAQLLKDQGYITGAIGKWHLGAEAGYQPQQRGFDEFFGFRGGHHSYYNHAAPAAILRGSQVIAEQAYLTDALGREATAFVERNRDSRFFLYLAFNAIHSPMEKPPDKYFDRFAHITDEKRRKMAAMLAAMDDAVGGVLAALRRHRLDDNTLIVFISDNGGPTHDNASRNDPLRGYKCQLHEGGIRVPFLMQWKSRIAGGRVEDSPVISLDIMPTALAAAGIESPANRQLDGVNLLPLLTRETTAQPHAQLYWRYGEQWAIRDSRYKLSRGTGGAPRLFDLSSDIGERRDLSAEHPDVVNRLKSEYQRWNESLMPPHWEQSPSERRQATLPAQ